MKGTTPMRLSREEIEHVALLGRLKLTEDEVAKYTEQLNDILSNFEQLNEVDTSQVGGTTHVVSLTNVFRPDYVRPSIPPDEALSNAPERIDDLFKVPRVVE
jgi:aspartyl-tRNA(Asn)/glutamyl-tRNA(Gln) amidotransferase subunit C